jgi:hypothetical protein
MASYKNRTKNPDALEKVDRLKALLCVEERSDVRHRPAGLVILRCRPGEHASAGLSNLKFVRLCGKFSSPRPHLIIPPTLAVFACPHSRPSAVVASIISVSVPQQVGIDAITTSSFVSRLARFCVRGTPGGRRLRYEAAQRHASSVPSRHAHV